MSRRLDQLARIRRLLEEEREEVVIERPPWARFLDEPSTEPREPEPTPEAPQKKAEPDGRPDE